jgi:hypothetical protein
MFQLFDKKIATVGKQKASDNRNQIDQFQESARVDIAKKQTYNRSY